MEEYKLLYNKRRGISSQFIDQKMVISLEKEKLRGEYKDYWCSKNLIEHLHSEWCITVDPNDSSLENFAITTCCLPLKIIICLPCHIGTGVNSILNCLYNTDNNTDNNTYKKTDKNYLF
jgi:hypothetical protein